MSAALDVMARLLERAGKKVIGQGGDKLTFSCPLHDDGTPSAGARVGDKVPMVAFCQVCGESASLPAMLEDLGASDADRALILGDKPGRNGPAPGELVHHIYTDAAGVPLVRKTRRIVNGKTYVKPDGAKDITTNYYNAGRWWWPGDLPAGFKKPDTGKLLYRLPEVLAAIREGKPVHVGEGERVCDALAALDFPATCNLAGASKPGAAPKWKSVHAAQLEGANSVVVWADRDDAGEAHAQAVARTLAAVGVEDVRIVRFPDLPEKSDLVDWLTLRRGKAREEVQRELPVLIDSTKPWKPENDSAALRDGVPAERNLPFRTAAELCAHLPEEVPWIVPGYVPRGALVELDGKVKAGKTTFVAMMVRQILDGGDFLGTPVAQGRVVWLTEQPGTSFADALRGAGLDAREDLILLQWADTRGTAWEKVAAAAVEKSTETGAVLLVVDTLGQFAGIRGDGENSAGEAQRAIEPLQVAAAAGLGVIVCRHERKSGGDIGDSGRGSSAWSGAVDVILKLSRPEGAQRDSVRVLEAVGRFRETPAEQVIELVDGTYHTLGTQQDVAAQEAREKLLGECPAEMAEALSLADLVERLKLKRTTCQVVLDQMVRDGLLSRTGEGKRGKPWRYHRPDPPGKGFCRNSIPIQTAPAESNPTPEKHSARTPAGSGRKASGIDSPEGDPERRALLNSHNWEPAPGVAFPTVGGHEAARHALILHVRTQGAR